MQESRSVIVCAVRAGNLGPRRGAASRAHSRRTAPSVPCAKTQAGNTRERIIRTDTRVGASRQPRRAGRHGERGAGRPGRCLAVARRPRRQARRVAVRGAQNQWNVLRQRDVTEQALCLRAAPPPAVSAQAATRAGRGPGRRACRGRCAALPHLRDLSRADLDDLVRIRHRRGRGRRRLLGRARHSRLQCDWQIGARLRGRLHHHALPPMPL